MKKIFLISILLFTVMLTSSLVSAQDNHTAREEAEGKAVWEKLQTKQLEYKNLTNDNFEVLGEYFMGKMTGSSHEAMNNMMTQMMGTEGEKQMHIAMGKRFTGTKGGDNYMMGNFYGNMMNNGWGLFGGLIWILVVVFLILGIIYFWKGINKKK